MALRIIQDSVTAGTSMVWDFDGAALTRKIVIGGVRDEMTSGQTQAGVIMKAVQQFNLYPGREYPNNASWMAWTVQLDPMPGNDKLVAVIRYRNIDYTKITLDGNVIRETTSLDSTGAVMKVDYTDSAGTVWPPDVGQGEAFRPGAVLEFERFERGFPSNLRDVYSTVSPLGAINSSDWQGCPKYTWMYTSCKRATFAMGSGGIVADMRGNAMIPVFTPTKYSFQFYGWGRGTGAQKVLSDWRRVILYKNWTLQQVQPAIDCASKLAQGDNGGRATDGWKRVKLQTELDFDTDLGTKPFPVVYW